VPTGARTRVYAVDAHPVFLAAVVEAIGARPELEFIAAATSGPDALAGVRALRPDVAVLDLRLPGLSGLELLRRAAADDAPTRIVVLSANLGHEQLAQPGALAEAGITTRARLASASYEDRRRGSSSFLAAGLRFGGGASCGPG